MVSFYGKRILIRNWVEFNNVQFVMILLILKVIYLRKHVKHVRRNSIPTVSWNGSVKVTRANAHCVSHNSCDLHET